MSVIANRIERLIDKLEDASYNHDWDLVDQTIRDLEILSEDLNSDFPMLGEDWEDDEI